MKILTISNCELSSNQGSGYVILGFVEAMRARGHTNEVFDIRSVTLFCRMRRLTRLRRIAGYTIRSVSLVLNQRFDVVELWGAEGWLSVLLLRVHRQITGQKYIIVSRSNGLETHYRLFSHRAANRLKSLYQSFLNRFLTLAFTRSDLLTLVSHFDSEFAIRSGYVQGVGALVLENALPDNWRNLCNHERRHETTIGFVGSWLPNKGVALLLRMISQILSSEIDARFLLVGVGEEGREQIFAEFGHNDRIEVIEHCERDTLQGLYHRMTVLVSLSAYESFGLVVAEAMACGVAVVATRTGFAASLLDKEAIVLVPRSEKHIVEAVTSLMRNHTLRTGVAHAGYVRVQGLSWARNIELLEKRYLEMLGARH